MGKWASPVGPVVVRIDSRYFRPAEVDTLLGDSSKAQQKLGWTPTIAMGERVAADQQEAAKEATLRREGIAVAAAQP
jgi:GDPmannose 4,6-dehydratase